MLTGEVIANLASFYPKSKQQASLMFHQGTQVPGAHPRLEGSGDASRVLKVDSLDEAERARADIERIVRAWCDTESHSSVRRGGSSGAAGP